MSGGPAIERYCPLDAARLTTADAEAAHFAAHVADGTLFPVPGGWRLPDGRLLLLGVSRRGTSSGSGPGVRETPEQAIARWRHDTRPARPNAPGYWPRNLFIHS